MYDWASVLATVMFQVNGLPPAHGNKVNSPGCLLGLRRLSSGPHHTSATAAALAASSSAIHFQDCGAGTPVSCWSSTRIRRRCLSPPVGCWPSLTPVELQRHENAAGTKDSGCGTLFHPDCDDLN